MPAASGVIVLAVLALLFMQYRSIRHAQEQTQATMKANLKLRLFEISEDARRGTLEHANHIMHAVRQKRIRERNIYSIELAFTRLVRRYPEIEDCYVVFFEKGKQDETWQALKFFRPDPDNPRVHRYDGVPIGSLGENKAASESLRRAWNSIEIENSQTTLYAAYDPQTVNNKKPKQYFFHTVYEVDRLKRTKPLENIGLLVFSADPDKFPSKDFLPNLAAKHSKRNKSMDTLLGNLDYVITLDQGDGKRYLVSKDKQTSPTLTHRFDNSDKLFPNLSFGVISPELDSTAYADDFFQSSIYLGIITAIIALIGLILTWRAAQSEMKIARLKSNFLAHISHELKTPLTSIRAFGDLIHSGRSKNIERIREYGGIIKTESDHLTQIINDILEMSRLEKGIRRFHLNEADLGETLKDTIEVFRHSPRAKGFEIDVRMPFVPVRAEYDEVAIGQAIINLLSNAVKYSKPDEFPKIEASLSVEENEAIIKVRDFGVGISSAEQKKIFIPFQRSTSDTVQAQGGTGLGLAITREIIKGHGGDVSFDSKLEDGSTFIIRLPILSEKPEGFADETLEAGNSGTYLGY